MQGTDLKLLWFFGPFPSKVSKVLQYRKVGPRNLKRKQMDTQKISKKCPQNLALITMTSQAYDVGKSISNNDIGKSGSEMAQF